MVSKRFILVSVLMFLTSSNAAVSEPSDYRLNPGDVLQISVWKEDQMDRETLVLPDGTISFPLVGTLQAGGHTVSEVRDDLTARLSKDIPGASVTVAVKAALGNAVQVIGQVVKSGEVAIGHRLTVMQALSIAGGLTPFASESDIRVLHRDANGVQQSIVFPYDDVIRGEALDKNVELAPGDVVMVPAKSLF